MTMSRLLEPFSVRESRSEDPEVLELKYSISEYRLTPFYPQAFCADLRVLARLPLFCAPQRSRVLGHTFRILLS